MENQALENLYSAYAAVSMVKHLLILSLQWNKQKPSIQIE